MLGHLSAIFEFLSKLENFYYGHGCHNCHKCLHFRGYSPRFLCNYLIFLLVLFTGGQYVWTSLCQFIFLWTSSIVYLFDFLTFDIFLTIWHLFDNLTSFWHFYISFNLNHPQPITGLFFDIFWAFWHHLDIFDIFWYLFDNLKSFWDFGHWLITLTTSAHHTAIF